MSSPEVVTGMIQVIDFTFYALLDSGASLSFVTLYDVMNFDFIPEQLIESFSVSTPVGEYILAEESIMIVLFPLVTRVPWLI